jgi:hypothetical protein
MEYKDDPLLKQMNNESQIFDNQFYIMLFIVLIIFMFGFAIGNIAHDKCCHAIEQSMK